MLRKFRVTPIPNAHYRFEKWVEAGSGSMFDSGTNLELSSSHDIVAQVPVGVLRIALARIAGRSWSIVARRRPRTSSSIPPEKGRRVWKVKRATNCGSAAGGFEFLIEDSFDSFRILCLLVGERCDVKHRQQDCHHDDCDQATHHDGNGRLQERHDIS